MSRPEKIPVTCDPHGKLERRPLADLTPFQGALKDLSTENYAKLRSSIIDEGFMAPVFVWRDKILDGHQRTTVIQREGWDVDGGVPVVEIEADSEQEAARKLLKLTSAYAKPQAEGVFDFMQTHDLALPDMTDVDLPDFDVGELEALFEPPPGEEPPEPKEPPSAPVSREGDLWCMGAHRLLCGDSTADTAVSRLLDGQTPFMMVTDPPYGVEYDPEWRNEAAENGSIAYAARSVGKVMNDDRADWSEAWGLFPGDVAYVWHADRRASEVQTSIEAAGFEIRCQIIWRKGRFAISRGHYHWGHEPCWYAVKKGKTARWCGDRKTTTVWDLNSDALEGGHGTTKPLEAMARPIRNHGSVGDIVYDPFLGSGTTLVAAQTEGRICYGMELDPAYVDVCVERYQDYTNSEAILDGDGRTFAEVKAERLAGDDVQEAA